MIYKYSFKDALLESAVREYGATETRNKTG